jgi:hypothetical protein
VDAINGSVWTIAGQQVTVGSGTEIKGSIAVGSQVKVHALPQADGTWLIREVELAGMNDDRDDNSGSDDDIDDNSGSGSDDDDDLDDNSGSNDDDDWDDNSGSHDDDDSGSNDDDDD